MEERLKVYYDNGCRLCHTEICHYKRIEVKEGIDFIDISADEFRAELHGLDAEAIHKNLHVRLPNGEIKIGVDAFREIWTRLPYYKHLVPVSNFPPIDWSLKKGYSIFTVIRPFLPRRRKEAV